MGSKQRVLLRGRGLDGRVVADVPTPLSSLRLEVTVEGARWTEVYLYNGSIGTHPDHGDLPVMRFWESQPERRAKPRPFRRWSIS